MLGGEWDTMPLPALKEVSAEAVAAEEKNAENMARDARGFSVPWDLPPPLVEGEGAARPA